MWRCDDPVEMLKSKGGMKLEAILLALATRCIEVGLKSRAIPEESPLPSAQVCQCSCTFVEQNSTSSSVVSAHWLLSIAATAGLTWTVARRSFTPVPKKHDSPRCKGRGAICYPGGDDLG